MKNRLIGLLILLISAGAILFNWWLLLKDGHYYMKLSWAGPFLALAGLVLIFYPSMGGRVQTASARQKAVIWIVIAVGAVLGIINAYLMYTY